MILSSASVMEWKQSLPPLSGRDKVDQHAVSIADTLPLAFPLPVKQSKSLPALPQQWHTNCNLNRICVPEHLQPGIHVFELKSIIFDSRKQLSIDVFALRVAVPNIKASFKLVDDGREFPIRCNYLHIATLYDREGAATD